MDTFSYRKTTRSRLWRSRWAAIGAAVAVTLGGGGMLAVNAASSAESSAVLIDPVRVLDTRDPIDVGLPGPFVSAGSQKLKVTGAVPTTSGLVTAVPAGATGVILNVTAVNVTADGFVSIRPGDAVGAPATSSLNVKAGVTVPNAVTVALPTSGANAGQIDITWDAGGVAGPTTDLLVDVVGYATTARLDRIESAVAALQTETVSYSGFAASSTGDFRLGTNNGCSVNLDLRNLLLPLPMPAGSSIIGVSASIYDTTTTAPYTVSLRRYASNGFGDGWTTLATATGGGGSLVSVTNDLTPATPEVVEPGERFVVQFDDGIDSFGNGLCGVTVTYRRSTTGADVTQQQPTNDVAPVPLCDDPQACTIETP